MLVRFLGGVFVGAHAVAEGALTRSQLQTGPFIRVLHGVYADPSLPRDHLLRCRAAALLMPREAALGGRSAAALLGAPAPGYAEPVTVVLPGEVRWTGPRGIRVHRAPVLPAEVETDDGLRRTTAERTAWDVAALETVQTAVGVLDAMVRSGLVDVASLERELRRGSRKWGRRRVRRALDLVDGRSESPPESWVRVACALAGLPAPVPQFEVWEDGVFLARSDLVWPEARLIVEYEGDYHFTDLHIERDDVRLSRLVAAGWRVIRLAAADLRDLDGVVHRIAQVLGVASPAA